jgi:hypothetical protein
MPPSTIATAQTLPAKSPSPLLSDTELDALLLAKNWNGLGEALSNPISIDEFVRKLNWLRTRTYNGGGFLLAAIYARDLWTVGDSLKKNDPTTDPRTTAGFILLYAYELVVIDGVKCEDKSALGNRANQLLTGQVANLAFLKQQQPDLKSKIIDLALALEQKTAPLRKDDDLICRNGLDEMRASLERGTQQEIPTPEGHIGKTIAVTPPVDYAPKFVASDVYHPLQDKARADMRERLLKLVAPSP